jgi:hypothetical protein
MPERRRPAAWPTIKERRGWPLAPRGFPSPSLPARQRNNAADGTAIMQGCGSDIASIALGILVGLVVALAFYFYFVAEFEPTARPPL